MNLPYKSEDMYFVRRILWGALIFAIILYNVLAFILTKGQDEVSVTSVLKIILILIAAITFLGLIIFRPRLIKPLNQAEVTNYSLIREAIPWALIESIALYGFVLSFVTKVFIYTVYFSVPAVFLFIVFAPNGGRR